MTGAGATEGQRKALRRTTDGQGNDQGAGSGETFDKLLKPGEGRGKTPNKAMSERSQSEWDTTIQGAMESARSKGQLPANIERMFGKRLVAKAEWNELYFLTLSKRVGNDRYSWEHLEPQLMWRGIGAPGRMSTGCGTLVFVYDTSGSIGQRTMDVLGTESVAFCEQVKPKQIIRIGCDAQVHDYMECDAADQLLDKFKGGGGGTDFRPVFDRIAREGIEPDVLVYLTDCLGDYPAQAPSYPVIWASITKLEDLNGMWRMYKPPFGDFVYLPQQVENE